MALVRSLFEPIALLETVDTAHMSVAGIVSSCAPAFTAVYIEALADAGEKAMKDHGILPHHVEGHRGGTWILQDYGDVVVHVFDKEARAFYDLDRLWADAKTVDLSDVLAQPDAE